MVKIFEKKYIDIFKQVFKYEERNWNTVFKNKIRISLSFTWRSLFHDNLLRFEKSQYLQRLNTMDGTYNMLKNQSTTIKNANCMAKANKLSQCNDSLEG